MPGLTAPLPLGIDLRCGPHRLFRGTTLSLMFLYPDTAPASDALLAARQLASAATAAEARASQASSEEAPAAIAAILGPLLAFFLRRGGIEVAASSRTVKKLEHFGQRMSKPINSRGPTTSALH